MLGWHQRTTTGPATTAISPTELKANARYSGTAEDALITAIITAATQWVEEYIGGRIITQSLTETIDGFPLWSDSIVIHCHPVTAVVVKYDDESDVEQTMADSLYWLHADHVPPMIQVKDSWPITEDKLSAVRLELSAGYANAAAVPQAIKQALLMVGSYWVDNRDAYLEGGIAPVSLLGVRSLLAPYRYQW